MNDTESAEIAKRLDRAQKLHRAIAPVFPVLRDFLADLAAQKTKILVLRNDENVRGRIQQIHELMDLPNALLREEQELQRILAGPDETTTRPTGLDSLTGDWP